MDVELPRIHLYIHIYIHIFKYIHTGEIYEAMHIPLISKNILNKRKKGIRNQTTEKHNMGIII